MLFLVALLFSTAFAQSVQYMALAQGIAQGAISPAHIQQAVLAGAIIPTEAAELLQMLSASLDGATAQAETQAEEATTSVVADQCLPDPEDATRYTTPVIDGIVGYGANQCSTLPDTLFTDPVVHPLVPDLSGTYVNDNGMCPPMFAGGNQLRIEQNGVEIIWIAAGVVHHFKSEAVGCPLVTKDIKSACVGHNAFGLPEQCYATATAVPNSQTGCWTLQAALTTVEWCKTDTGVTREVAGMPIQTFTAVGTRRRKQ